MNLSKKILSLALVLVMMCALVIPAAALDSEWRYEFRNQFPMLSQGSGRTGYVCALQSFLSAHSSSKSAMSGTTGIDGSFGSGTANALKKFQTYAGQYLIYGMSVDGIAGGDTWASVAIELTPSGSDFVCNGARVMRCNSSSLSYYKNGSAYYFHTIVGDVPEY